MGGDESASKKLELANDSPRARGHYIRIPGARSAAPKRYHSWRRKYPWAIVNPTYTKQCSTRKLVKGTVQDETAGLVEEYTFVVTVVPLAQAAHDV